MKRTMLIFILLLSIFTTSCSRSEPLVDSGNSVVSVSDSYGDSETKSNNTNKLKADWSNWVDGSLNTSHGMSVNLFESVNNGVGDKVVTANTVIDDELSLYLAYNLEVSATVEKDNAIFTVLVLINDKICDFSLEDLKSDSGILTTNSAVNKDIIQLLTVSDCDMNEGDNKISVILSAYYPQIGHSDIVQIIRQFKSNKSQKQTHNYLTPDRHESIINYTDNTDISVLSESRNFSFVQNKYEHACSYVNSGTEINYRYINSNEANDNGVERNVLCIAFENGKPIDLLNQMPVVILPLTQFDYAFDFPIGKIENKSEYTYISFSVVDLNEEINADIDEHLFYAE